MNFMWYPKVRCRAAEKTLALESSHKHLHANTSLGELMAKVQCINVTPAVAADPPLKWKWFLE